MVVVGWAEPSLVPQCVDTCPYRGGEAAASPCPRTESESLRTFLGGNTADAAVTPLAEPKR